MRIVSWNVNGLRALLKKGFLSFINDYQPDIIGIQETKLQESQIPREIIELETYHKYWSFADRAGYSGTCLLTKIKPQKITFDIEDKKFSYEGRIIQAEYTDFVLLNIYFPNGQKNDERLNFKLQFYDQFLTHIKNISKTGKNIIIIGDFNTAHKEIDLAHPKANEKYSGFLPIERAWMDKFIESGYIDTFRYLDKRPHQYTWWTYRLNAREKNIGWRIDYCFVNTDFCSKVKSSFIYNEVMGSDHCPVGIEL